VLPPTISKLQKLQYIHAGITLPLDEDDDWITNLFEETKEDKEEVAELQVEGEEEGEAAESEGGGEATEAGG
jgi:hypothetical protein